MRCEVTSSTEHKALISRELRVPTFKHVCRGEKKKVNLGYNNDYKILKVENNTLFPSPKRALMGTDSKISQTWEVLSTFFKIHHLIPKWLDCHMSWGHYDELEGGWTGCMGKVRGLLAEIIMNRKHSFD